MKPTCDQCKTFRLARVSQKQIKHELKVDAHGSWVLRFNCHRFCNRPRLLLIFVPGADVRTRRYQKLYCRNIGNVYRKMQRRPKFRNDVSDSTRLVSGNGGEAPRSLSFKSHIISVGVRSTVGRESSCSCVTGWVFPTESSYPWGITARAFSPNLLQEVILKYTFVIVKGLFDLDSEHREIKIGSHSAPMQLLEELSIPSGSTK